MSGANSLSEALELQNKLTQMFSSARLVLRKWASNCNELLNSIDSDMRLSNASLNIDNDDTVKTLGILWHPASDTDSSVPSLNDVPEERCCVLQSTIVPNRLPDVNDLLHKFSF
ncbi:hypothetical protein TNIN_115921 [Trichonephila inaurata madagascariensis]|uniref:Uncharacterized protein n=1 Tax=Trichonephila inaurata madagascariensis TaxID=2747483 RepID=A0A8X6Y2K8_9ARAC|nr:hypothetical protein TNIN_115921 [Trichonephila inaurata madagascariensis]